LFNRGDVFGGQILVVFMRDEVEQTNYRIHLRRRELVDQFVRCLPCFHRGHDSAVLMKPV
jgi:hypothetical protein